MLPRCGSQMRNTEATVQLIGSIAGGMGHFYPEEWQEFEQHVATAVANDQLDPIELYWQRLQQDAVAASEAARMWMKWDGLCGTLLPDRDEQLNEDIEFALTAAKIGTHWYQHQQQWYSDDYILDKLRSGVLAGVPVRLVNGRYDLLCPPRWSHEVWLALCEGDAECDGVDIVEAAGHAGSEGGIKEKMCSVMDALLTTIRQTKHHCCRRCQSGALVA